MFRFATFLLLAVCFAVAPLRADDEAEPKKSRAGKSMVRAAVSSKPTEANVPYGKHPKQVVDFFRAESPEPTPVVVYIHGGGWRNGTKDQAEVESYRSQGISVVAVEYRFIDEATQDGVVPPVKGPLGDAARAVQFIRSKAKEWNLDKTRFAATGSSAGGCSSLWLAFHDDLADPNSDDPIARESTRLQCAAVLRPQTTLDPKQMKEWTPNSKYGGHAFGIEADTAKNLSEFDVFLAKRDELLPWIKEYSPYELVTSDDPPVALYFEGPPAMGQEQKDPTHTTNFGAGLAEKCKTAGVECRLVHRGSDDKQYPTIADVLIAKLKQR